MSTSTIANIEYLTAHPLSWSKDVRESLKVEIVVAARCLPAQRSLASDVHVNPSHLAVVGLTPSLKYSGFGGFLYRCLKSVKSADDELLDVSFSPNPIDLKRPTGSVFIFAKHYKYREIPFLAFVTPDDVRHAREQLSISDAGTFDITSYYLAVLIALPQQAVKFFETKRDAYPVIKPPFPRSRTVAMLMHIGLRCISDRGRQGNDRPECARSNPLPGQVRTGHGSN